MDSYLTPAQFRALDLGADVAGWIDAKIAPFLARASAEVNAYCLAPDLPVPHSFLGGSIVGETHTWRTDPYANRPTRRLFPFHPPVIEVTKMRLFATTTQYLDFSAAELYFEESEGWIEPASANLTSYGLFGSAVLPFVGLTEPYAELDYSYGRRIPETLRLFYQGDGGYLWRASSGFWASDDIEVRVNGNVEDPLHYTINRVEGTLLFTETNHPNGSDLVEADEISRIDYPISVATGLIANAQIIEKGFTADGFPAGIRSLKVAEVSIDRGMPRSSSKTTEISIPEKAAEMLDPFIFRPVSFF